jgi:acyl carrier protein
MTRSEALAVITEVLGTVASTAPSDVAPERTLAELGLDSLATLEVVVAAEDRFGVLIPDDEWARFATIGDIVDHLEKAAVVTA